MLGEQALPMRVTTNWRYVYSCQLGDGPNLTLYEEAANFLKKMFATRKRPHPSSCVTWIIFFTERLIWIDRRLFRSSELSHSCNGVHARAMYMPR